MSLPQVVSREDWLVARKELLVEENELTRRRDALSAERRRLPMVEIEKDYVFEGPDGECRLLELFEGRRQLIVQPFMFGPTWDEGCPSCTAQPIERPGLSCFLRNGDSVYHTYSTYARGGEMVGGSNYFLDLTALGRQEEWEEPKGRATAAREADPSIPSR